MAALARKRPPGPGGLLVPVGPVEREPLEFLRLILPETFGLEFRLHGEPLSADPCHDPLRRQWNAGTLLQEIDEIGRRAGAARVLGVTSFDLFIPILTFVFGLAQLGSRSAVVSLHRLWPEFYGAPADRDLLLRRLEKEVVHELGHTFGLRHCPDHACVMHYGNTVDQIDLKEAAFCPLCAPAVAAETQRIARG